ncbi:MAG: monofunctional biosynthetic peptidoglycan transglycosylase [Anaerolineae bacterium]
MRRLRKVALFALIGFLVMPVVLVLVYRALPPLFTPIMVVRLFEGEGIKKKWIPLSVVSRHVPAAAIALEDNLFCEHSGFDWASIFEAAADYQRGNKPLHGGSTISQQTAKNVFLWPSRTFTRKAIETPFTMMIEYFWDKRRIMEVYLNVVEWGPGIYGVEAAAQAYFGKSARRLTRREAALLAAVLPNARRWSPAAPTRYIRRRAASAMARMRKLGPLLRCIQ